MLVIVRAVPATESDQSAEGVIDEPVKLQPLFTKSDTKVSPTAIELNAGRRPSLTVTAADAEMSEPFCSIQRKSEPIELLPIGVQEVAQYAIDGTVNVVEVMGVVSSRLV